MIHLFTTATLFRRARMHLLLVTAFALVAIAPSGGAALPEGISYQGYLTNADGSPVNGSICHIQRRSWRSTAVEPDRNHERGERAVQHDVRQSG